MSALALLASAAIARADTVSIAATGTVQGSCSLTKTADFPAANFAASGSVNASATVSCNSGFTVKAQSSNGAIKTATPVTSEFTDTLPYSLQVSVPLDAGGPASATCGSASLAAGQSGCALSPAGTGLSSGGVSAMNSAATLTVSWTTPTAPRLIAGTYSDTLTVTIATAP